MKKVLSKQSKLSYLNEEKERELEKDLNSSKIESFLNKKKESGNISLLNIKEEDEKSSEFDFKNYPNKSIHNKSHSKKNYNKQNYSFQNKTFIPKNIYSQVNMNIKKNMSKKNVNFQNISKINILDDEHKNYDQSFIEESYEQIRNKYKNLNFKLSHNKKYYNKLPDNNLNEIYIKLVEDFHIQNRKNQNLNDEFDYYKFVFNQLPDRREDLKNFKIKHEVIDNSIDLKKQIIELNKKELLYKNKIKQLKQSLKHKIRKNEDYLNKLKKKKLIKTVTDNNNIKRKISKEEYLRLIDETKKRIIIEEENVRRYGDILKNKGWSYTKLVEDNNYGVNNSKNTKHNLIDIKSNMKILENEKQILRKKVNNCTKIIQNLNSDLAKLIEENNIKQNKLKEYEFDNPYKLQSELETLIQKESIYKARFEELMNNDYLKQNRESSTIWISLNENRDKKIKSEAIYNELNERNENFKENLVEIKENIKIIKEENIKLEEELIYLENVNENNLGQFNKENSFLNNDNENNYLKILKIVNKNQYLKKIQNDLVLKNKINNKEEFYENIFEEKNEMINKLEIAKNILKENMKEEKSKEEKFRLDKLEILSKVEKIKNEISGIDNILGKFDFKENKPFTIGFNKFTGEEYYYDNNISMFSENSGDYENLTNMDDNILDIFIGKYEIDNLNYDKNNFLVSVSFKNYEAGNSDLINGINGNFNFVSSFVVNTNSINLLNLYEEKINIEIYMKGFNNDIEKFALGTIKLKDLIDDNSNNVSNKSCSVKNNILGIKSLGNEVILGNIHYSIRFRIPIMNNLNLVKKEKDKKVEELFTENRNIYVKIEQGYDFPLTCKSFLNYEFFNYKEITKPILGTTPNFNLQKKYLVTVDKKFKDLIRNEKFEISFFDDSIPLEEIEDDEDFIGSCLINLTNLLYDKPIYGKFPIYKNQKQKCFVLISIYFEDFPLELNLNDLKYDKIWENKAKKFIVSKMKLKKLNLKSLFFNKNHRNKSINDIITKDQFYCSIKNLTLEYFNEHEIYLIYDFIKKKNPLNKKFKNKNEISLIEIENYLGNLLTFNMINNDISYINSMFQENDENLDRKLNKEDFLINKVKTIFENFMRKEKLNPRKLLILLDDNKNGLLCINELLSFFKKNNIKNITEDEIQKIFDWADIDKDNNIDIKEFFYLIHLESKEIIDKGTSFLKMKTSKTINDNLLLTFIDQFQAYMKENNLTLLNIYNILDSNKNQELNKTEFKNKMIKKFNCNFTDLEFDYLFNKIDDNNSGTIQIEEFLKIFEKKDILKKMENFDYNNSLSNNNIIKNIYNFIIQNELTIAEFILKIDDDDNGSISMYELNAFLRKNEFYKDDKELEEFFKLINSEGKLEFDSKELNEIIFAYDIKIVKAEKLLDDNSKYKLLNRIKKIFSTKRKELLKNFESCEKDYTEGIISVSDFRNIIEELTNLTSEEIDFILNPLMISYWNMDKIKYKGFLDILKINKEFIDNFRLNIKKNSFDDLFKNIIEMCKKNDMDNFSIYQIFTDNGKRKFNLDTFKIVLEEMKLEYDSFHLEEFFDRIDFEKDGEITFNEFVKLVEVELK